MQPVTLIWIYIVLLVAGGVYGFVKAGSKPSLIASLAFGVLLTLAALGYLGTPYAADLLLVVLVIVFSRRFQKTKKLMPAGVMTLLTLSVLALRGIMFLS